MAPRARKKTTKPDHPPQLLSFSFASLQKSISEKPRTKRLSSTSRLLMATTSSLALPLFAGGGGSDRLSQEIFSILESNFLFGAPPPEGPAGYYSSVGRVRVLSIDGGADGARSPRPRWSASSAGLRSSPGTPMPASPTTLTWRPAPAPAGSSPPRCSHAGCRRRRRATSLPGTGRCSPAAVGGGVACSGGRSRCSRRCSAT